MKLSLYDSLYLLSLLCIRLAGSHAWPALHAWVSLSAFLRSGVWFRMEDAGVQTLCIIEA